MTLDKIKSTHELMVIHKLSLKDILGGQTASVVKTFVNFDERYRQFLETHEFPYRVDTKGGVYMMVHQTHADWYHPDGTSF